MRQYVMTLKVKEGFPMELYESWSVKEGNRLAENWKVIDHNLKKTRFDILVTEYIEDENAIYS